ncbi:LOW QUALITY PROTEIN: Phenoloxidase-activating factor 2, partial [Gryllus bimaculatus]
NLPAAPPPPSLRRTHPPLRRARTEVRQGQAGAARRGARRRSPPAQCHVCRPPPLCPRPAAPARAAAVAAAAGLLFCLRGAPQSPPPPQTPLLTLPAPAARAAHHLDDAAARQRPAELVGPVRGPCVCVMYYLCNLATNSVYIYGEDVLDERFGGDDKVPSCPTILEHCCRIPPKEETADGGVAVRPPLPPAGPVVGAPDPQPQPQPPVGPPAPTPSQPPHVNVNPPREGDVSTRWECGVRRTDFALLDTWARVDDKESDEVSFAEFPWTLVVIQNADEKWLGGASLVSPRIALTAAHSVHGSCGCARAVGPASTEERCRTRSARAQCGGAPALPPRRALLHDAALLCWRVPFRRRACTVAPVSCRPSGASVRRPPRASPPAWAPTRPGKNGALRQLLRRVELPVVPRDECQERLRTTRLGVFYHLHDSFMCAGAENGKDTCKILKKFENCVSKHKNLKFASDIVCIITYRLNDFRLTVVMFW